MRIGRRAVLVLCLVTAVMTGCSLSDQMQSRNTREQHITMQLGNVSSVTVEATNLPGRLDLGTGRNGIDFEAIFPSKVQSNVERQDSNFTVTVNGLAAATDARSRVVAPFGKEMSLALNGVARPLEVVIGYSTTKHLRASGISAPLTVRMLSNSNLSVVLDSGHGSFQLDVPDAAVVEVQGSLKAEQMEALTKFGFVKDGSTWIRKTQSQPSATVYLQVEGWTGVLKISSGKAG